MSTATAMSKILLVTDAPQPASPAAMAVRKYRFARLRLDPPPPGAGRGDARRRSAD